MRWRVVAVGKPKLGFVAEGVNFYLKRVSRWTTIEFLTVRSGRPEIESRELERATDGWFRILLDEHGEQIRSAQLARKLESWEAHGPKKISLLIGGAEGHISSLKNQADWVWSLSSLTLQHEIALLVALEQIYRAYTITRGTPYHRE